MAAADEVRHFYATSEDSTYDIGVSGDGTWRKRGYTSFNGVTSLISVISGKIWDVEVKSSHCKSCNIWALNKGTPEFEAWLPDHIPVCDKNYSGSSGSMECESVVSMFSRSEDLHCMRYVEHL